MDLGGFMVPGTPRTPLPLQWQEPQDRSLIEDGIRVSFPLGHLALVGDWANYPKNIREQTVSESRKRPHLTGNL